MQRKRGPSFLKGPVWFGFYQFNCVVFFQQPACSCFTSGSVGVWPAAVFMSSIMQLPFTNQFCFGGGEEGKMLVLLPENQFGRGGGCRDIRSVAVCED